MSENLNEENSHNSEDEIDQSLPATPRKLSGTLELERNSGSGGSFVWCHFTKDLDYKNNKKASCNHCNKVYICSGSSTSGLTKHLRNVHNIIQQNQEQTGKTNVLTMLQTSKVNTFYFFLIYLDLNLILLMTIFYLVVI